MKVKTISAEFNKSGIRKALKRVIGYSEETEILTEILTRKGCAEIVGDNLQIIITLHSQELLEEGFEII